MVQDSVRNARVNWSGRMPLIFIKGRWRRKHVFSITRREKNTSRGSGSGIDWKEFTQKQVDGWGVKHHELLLGKPQYDIFVDDRAINNKDWYKKVGVTDDIKE